MLRGVGGEVNNHPGGKNSYRCERDNLGAQAHHADSNSMASCHWSDSTLTGSGRCSVYSWGLDEAVRNQITPLVV